MKKIAIILLFITASLSCNNEQDSTVEERIRYDSVIRSQRVGLHGTINYYDNGYQIVVIDSCEYIFAWFGMANGGGSLTHKGNCKSKIHLK